jgi:hypothetical protein
MAAAIALAVLAASFLVALGLRVRTKVHWFTAWLLGALVLPVIMWISEMLYPTGWLGVALFFGGLVSAAVAALGVLIGWLIVRKRADHIAS